MRIPLPSTGTFWGYLFTLSVLGPPAWAVISGVREAGALTDEVYEGLGNGLAWSAVFVLCAALGRIRWRRNPTIHVLSTFAWLLAWLLASLALGSSIQEQLQAIDAVDTMLNEFPAFPGGRAGPIEAIFALILLVVYAIFGFFSSLVTGGLVWQSLWFLALLAGFVSLFVLAGELLTRGFRAYYLAHTEKFRGPDVAPPPPAPEDRHLRIVGWINLWVGGVALAGRGLTHLAVFAFGMHGEGGDSVSPGEEVLALGAFGLIYLLSSVGAVFDVLLGRGILRGRSWSRPVGIFLGAAAVLQAPLCFFFIFNLSWLLSPLWALLGVYQIWALARAPRGNLVPLRCDAANGP